MAAAAAAVPVPGLTAAPVLTAVHCDADGHDTPYNGAPGINGTGVGVPGEFGSNVTSLPDQSTAEHCELDGHETASGVWPLSTMTGVGVPGEVGSNVTSWPLSSTAVH